MSAYRDWHVGMKVVCIVPAEQISEMQAAYPGSVYPHHNGIYTIREIRDDAPWNGGECHLVLLLDEICHRQMIGKTFAGGHCFVEPGFDVHGFRPVQTRKTDISVFTQLLTKVGEDA